LCKMVNMTPNDIDRNRQRYSAEQQRFNNLVLLIGICVVVLACFYLAVVAT
jgi:hypothetical protein